MQTRQEIRTPLTLNAWHSCYEALRTLLAKETFAQEYMERLESIKSGIEETMRQESQTTLIQGYVFTPQIESLQNLYEALIKQTKAVELKGLRRLIQTFLNNNPRVLDKINPNEISNGRFIIPFGVTSIGDFAFKNCTALTSISIPVSVNLIGCGAFSGCTALTSIRIPNRMFGISRLAFEGCTALTSIRIPNRMTWIGSLAFKGCTALTSIRIPARVAFIQENTFKSCTSLTSITIPSRVMQIGAWAFDNCTSLTSIRIPASVTSIGRGAFDNCGALTTVIIDANNQQRYQEILCMLPLDLQAIAKRVDVSGFKERFVTTMVNERKGHGFFGSRGVPGDVTGIILSKLSKTYDLPPIDEKATGKCVNDKITASLAP